MKSAFHTMLFHISGLFTQDNASHLADISGFPPPTGFTSHMPLYVLMELEKRGLFSYENVDPLIGVLTDLHRVDIINTCGLREYKEKVVQAGKLYKRINSLNTFKLSGDEKCLCHEKYGVANIE